MSKSRLIIITTDGVSSVTTPSVDELDPDMVIPYGNLLTYPNASDLVIVGRTHAPQLMVNNKQSLKLVYIDVIEEELH